MHAIESKSDTVLVQPDNATLAEKTTQLFLSEPGASKPRSTTRARVISFGSSANQDYWSSITSQAAVTPQLSLNEDNIPKGSDGRPIYMSTPPYTPDEQISPQPEHRSDILHRSGTVGKIAERGFLFLLTVFPSLAGSLITNASSVKAEQQLSSKPVIAESLGGTVASIGSEQTTWCRNATFEYKGDKVYIWGGKSDRNPTRQLLSQVYRSDCSLVGRRWCGRSKPAEKTIRQCRYDCDVRTSRAFNGTTRQIIESVTSVSCDVTMVE